MDDPSRDQQQEGQNIVHLPDGRLAYFPKSVSPQQMQDALGLGIPIGPTKATTPTPSSLPSRNQTIDFLRPFISDAAGTVAGIGTALIPGVGEIPGSELAAGNLGYTGMDMLLKKLKTGDQQPSSTGESFLGSEKDAILNAVTQGIMKSVFRGAKAFYNADQPEIYKYLPTTSQALTSYGMHALATLPKFAEDFGAPAAKRAALDESGGAGFTQSLLFANKINGRMATTNINPEKLADRIRETLEQGINPSALESTKFQSNVHYLSEDALDVLKGGQNPFAKIDAVLQDSDRLGKVLAAGQAQGISGLNVKKDLKAYQFMRIVHDATTKGLDGSIRIDPTKLTEAWTNPNTASVRQTLWGTQGQQEVTDLFKKIAVTQDQMTTYPVAKALRFVDGGFKLGAEALAGTVSLGAAAKSVGALYIPIAAMGRAMTDHKVARVLTAMAGAEPLEQGGRAAVKVLTDAFQGSSIAIEDANGKKTWGTFDKDGQFIENK